MVLWSEQSSLYGYKVLWSEQPQNLTTSKPYNVQRYEKSAKQRHLAQKKMKTRTAKHQFPCRPPLHFLLIEMIEMIEMNIEKREKRREKREEFGFAV